MRSMVRAVGIVLLLFTYKETCGIVLTDRNNGEVTAIAT